MCRLDVARASLFVCDLQAKFRPLIHNVETVLVRSALCVRAAKELSMPVVTTEQYSKVFGHTIDALAAHLPASPPVFEKTLFSMLTPDVRACMDSNSGGSGVGGGERDQVVIVGIEAHVCVLHTVLDLLADGKEVHVVSDAVSSQRPHDREAALQRMSQAGAVITTSESMLFDLLRDARHPHFRACSGLLKEANAAATWEE